MREQCGIRHLLFSGGKGGGRGVGGTHGWPTQAGVEGRFQRQYRVQAALCGKAILRPPYIINVAQLSAG